MLETYPAPTSANEIDSEAPEPPEILIDHMTLYHGSGVKGIQALRTAEEDTVGQGIYFVDNPEDAAGYARRRAKHGKDASPVIYEVLVNNLKLVNLNNEEQLERVMSGFAAELQRLKDAQPDAPWYATAAIDRSLEEIRSGIKLGQVKKAVQAHTAQFSVYLKDLGYDGLKTREGGEGDDVGEHDTYLIFEPLKVELVSEQPIT